MPAKRFAALPVRLSHLPDVGMHYNPCDAHDRQTPTSTSPRQPCQEVVDLMSVQFSTAPPNDVDSTRSFLSEKASQSRDETWCRPLDAVRREELASTRVADDVVFLDGVKP